MLPRLKERKKEEAKSASKSTNISKGVVLPKDNVHKNRIL